MIGKSRPRVAVIGNMNNNSNNLVRYLEDAGLMCEVLFFSNEADHFSPEADNLRPPVYKWRKLSWGSYRQLFTTSVGTIRQDVEPYDFLIGSRLAPSYLEKAGIKLDLFMPTGGELHMLPMFSGYAFKDLVKFIFF